jgi:prephenate dehydrogenase
MSCIAFLGYGRFGAALGGLFRDFGMRVRALDPGAPIPSDARAGSVADLVEGASFVAVAVPLSDMREAFASLRPHVRPEQVVFDVGSVKVAPSALLATTFGNAIPWVATHPLFGPVSLACGERPLRTVICPNALHPGAVARVTALFESIGCIVHLEDADAHDRSMALTHALAFFVAKGMLDAGAPAHLAYAPPSFQGLTRTIEAVRGDAGHLFVALHRENPYAADARRALLNALNAIDRGLADPASSPAATAALSIPDLGACSPDLREARELIDELDRELLALLARRAVLSKRAAAAKAGMGAAVRDPRREAALLEARHIEAQRLGLEPAAVADVFEAILRFSRGLQRK